LCTRPATEDTRRQSADTQTDHTHIYIGYKHTATRLPANYMSIAKHIVEFMDCENKQILGAVMTET